MKKEDPLVSIIISNYNYADYVGDAIESALRQSYSNIEVLVVDDGSTDNSRDVISGFGEKVKTVYVDHRGQCACLNEGLRISGGDFVHFLDSDDCLLEDAISHLIKPYRERDDISQCQGYLAVVDRNLVPLKRRIPKRLSPTGSYREQTLRRGLGVCRHAYTSGSLWPRWLLEGLFPLPETPEGLAGGYLGPDGYLNNAARLYGSVASLHQPVAQYRVHGDNFWHGATAFNIGTLKAHLSTIDSYHDYLYGQCQKLGYTPDLCRWKKWKQSWADNLTVLSLSLMGTTQRRPKFHEVVLAPLMSGTTRPFKALFVVPMLIFIWFAPRRVALDLSKRILQRKMPWLAQGGSA